MKRSHPEQTAVRVECRGDGGGGERTSASCCCWEGSGLFGVEVDQNVDLRCAACVLCNSPESAWRLFQGAAQSPAQDKSLY